MQRKSASDDKVFYATKIVEEPPKYFVDSIDSCDHVVELNSSDICYTIRQSHNL